MLAFLVSFAAFIAMTAHSYILVQQQMAYSSAQSYCRSQYGTDLASIHSDDDNNAAKDLCRQTGKSCFVGLSDIERDGTFAWEDGTAFDYGSDISGGVYPWEPDNGGEPSSTYDDEDCVLLWYAPNFGGDDHDWNDGFCDVNNFFLCNAPPTQNPSSDPTLSPTSDTQSPTKTPSFNPSQAPSDSTLMPTNDQTRAPTDSLSEARIESQTTTLTATFVEGTATTLTRNHDAESLMQKLESDPVTIVIAVLIVVAACWFVVGAGLVCYNFFCCHSAGHEAEIQHAKNLQAMDKGRNNVKKEAANEEQPGKHDVDAVVQDTAQTFLFASVNAGPSNAPAVVVDNERDDSSCGSQLFEDYQAETQTATAGNTAGEDDLSLPAQVSMLHEEGGLQMAERTRDTKY